MRRAGWHRWGAGGLPRAATVATALAVATLGGVRGTQDAVANGDTRTLSIVHEHTKESATITFRRNGVYDQDALNQLNWLLRDWRLDEPTRMNPKLFDIVWQVYREVGSQEPIHVVSAYRSPQTNAMLRRRSKAVAEHSQHMRGFAMDFFLTDVPMSRVREVGMRLQDGGVGFYPNAFNPFVHLDAGSVRSWPRMPGIQLARLFPDGRTVHIPREGRPLAGYDEAKAEILARGGSVAGYSTVAEGETEGSGRKSLWAMLFGGGGDDEDTEFYRAQPGERAGTADRRGSARVAAAAPAPSWAGNSNDGGARAFFANSGGASSPAPQAGASAPAPVGAVRPIAVAVASEPRQPPVAAASPLLDPEPIAELDAGSARTRAPVPPRRPGDLDLLLTAAAVPLPPARPVQTASLAGNAAPVAPVLQGEMQVPPPRRLPPPPPGDERAALHALFEAVANPGRPFPRADVSVTRTYARPFPPVEIAADEPGAWRAFSSAGPDEPRSDSFTGAAVAPASVLR